MITKFERDIGYKSSISDYFSYQFIGAFPLAVAPMRVSYGTSDKLTVSVTMAYQRYITINNPSSFS